MSIVYRPSAVAELTDLLADITRHDPRAAARVAQKVRDAADLLEANPLMGAVYRSRNPALAGVRWKTVIRYRQFVIIYRPITGGVEIMHILRGRRNLAAILQADDD